MPPKKPNRRQRYRKPTAAEASNVMRAGVTATISANEVRTKFELYPSQQELADVVVGGLTAGVQVVAVELPTGCGKTLALLKAVRQFQHGVHFACDIMRALHYKRQGELRAMQRRSDFAAASKAAAAAKRAVVHRPETQERLPRSGIADTDSDDDSDSTISDYDVGGVDGDVIFEDDWDVAIAQVSAAISAGMNIVREPSKKSRIKQDRDRGGHKFPQVFYCSRTHAQIAQVAAELDRLSGSAGASIRMNIMAGRDRLCINPRVAGGGRNEAHGNGMGEMCDKLVAVQQCSAVSGFVKFAGDVLNTGPEGAQSGARQKGRSAGAPRWWDIEDLVSEGKARDACPYYAAREMAYDADLNLCTYNYLFDPIIRAETKFERALRHAIVIVDEAHNLPGVCQSVLSLTTGVGTVAATLAVDLVPLLRSTMGASTALAAIFGEAFAADSNGIADLVARERRDKMHSLQSCLPELGADGAESFAFAYNRELKLPANWRLVDAFQVLLCGFGAVMRKCAEAAQLPEASSRGHVTLPGMQMLAAFRKAGLAPVLNAAKARRVGSGVEDAVGSEASLMRAAYGVVCCLGVTFNPFDISIAGLALLKRLILVMRFCFHDPNSFVMIVTPAAAAADAASGGEDHDGRDGTGQSFPATDLAKHFACSVTIRCLSGSLALQHLAKAASCVVLASGTLSPFSALEQSLGLSLTKVSAQPSAVDGGTSTAVPSPLSAVEFAAQQAASVGETSAVLRGHQWAGAHVVDTAKQCRVLCCTTTASGRRLHCTYATYNDKAFIDDLAATILAMLDAVPEGALILFPSFATCEKVHTAATVLQRRGGARLECGLKATIKELFVEPRSSVAFPGMWERFKKATVGARGAVLFAVHRGKVSEGLNFADSTARLVACVGIPFQPTKDAVVEAQRGYSGERWYTDDAIGAINQGLGRCLRHKDDWGAMVLLDARFDETATCNDDAGNSGGGPAQKLSLWIRRELRTVPSVPTLCERLADFAKGFASASAKPTSSFGPMHRGPKHVDARDVVDPDSGSAGTSPTSVPVAAAPMVGLYSAHSGRTPPERQAKPEARDQPPLEPQSVRARLGIPKPAKPGSLGAAKGGAPRFALSGSGNCLASSSSGTLAPHPSSDSNAEPRPARTLSSKSPFAAAPRMHSASTLSPSSAASPTAPVPLTPPTRAAAAPAPPPPRKSATSLLFQSIGQQLSAMAAAEGGDTTQSVSSQVTSLRPSCQSVIDLTLDDGHTSP